MPGKIPTDIPPAALAPAAAAAITPAARPPVSVIQPCSATSRPSDVASAIAPADASSPGPMIATYKTRGMN